MNYHQTKAKFVRLHQKKLNWQRKRKETLIRQHPDIKVDKHSALSKYISFGSIPRNVQAVQRLVDLNIKHVISVLLPMEYSGLDEYYDTLRMNELKIFVKDHAEPSVNYLRTAVEYLLRKEILEEKVFVHCKGGRGCNGVSFSQGT